MIVHVSYKQGVAQIAQLYVLVYQHDSALLCILSNSNTYFLM